MVVIDVQRRMREYSSGRDISERDRSQLVSLEDVTGSRKFSGD